MAKRGRPTKLVPKLAEELFARLAAGESLRRICRDDHMPTAENVRQRILADADFQAQYTRAREMGLDAMADELLDIADDGTNDWGINSKGNEKPNIDHIKRSALRVDARKWYLAKLAPKRYGEKVNHEVSGKDGAPVTFRWAATEEEVPGDS